MAKVRTYACPGIDGNAHEFSFLHHPSAEPAPRYCPMCGLDSQADEEPIKFQAAITSPMVANPKHKSGDNVYRAYEESTATNARVAAEMSGTSVAEQSNLKVTDFDTQVRAGDLSVKPIVNDVSRFMDANPQAMVQANAQAMSYAAMAHQGGGSDAHAGARAMSAARELHGKYGPQIVASGQTVLKGQAPSVPNMLSEIPTLELHNKAMQTGGKRTY